MTGETLWLTEADVTGLMNLDEAILALEAGLTEEREGQAINMTKTHAIWGEGDTLHAIGAVFPRLGWFGTKTWGHTRQGATPIFLLWEAATGHLAAVIEAFALGQMRSGGISGVATRCLADPAADELAVIGSGKQALTQVAAVALVRQLKRVRIFSPTVANRSAFAERLRREDFGFEVVEAGDVAEAVLDAPIVTTVTRAREPFLEAAMVAPGAHVNAVGAITPERRELAPSLLARCGLMAIDNPADSRLASELANAFPGKESTIRLADLVGRPRPALAPGGDLTIFKTLGMGISDLSLAVELLRRARAARLGRSFPHPVRAAPRLKR
jgi:alanine dehydrogenase